MNHILQTLLTNKALAVNNVAENDKETHAGGMNFIYCSDSFLLNSSA